METQLIGHHPGENFTMTITFADDYKNEDLRGKEATIDMTVNGIYGTAKK
jgi:trigger factor